MLTRFGVLQEKNKNRNKKRKGTKNKEKTTHTLNWVSVVCPECTRGIEMEKLEWLLPGHMVYIYEMKYKINRCR